MVWCGRCIASQGGRVQATSGRKKKEGVHLYPTATLRLPASPFSVNEWRVRIRKRQHAIAVGVSCSTLEPGRVLGRDMSRGLAWWLTPDGDVFDGGFSPPRSTAPRPKNRHVLKFAISVFAQVTGGCTLGVKTSPMALATLSK